MSDSGDLEFDPSTGQWVDLSIWPVKPTVKDPNEMPLKSLQARVQSLKEIKEDYVKVLKEISEWEDLRAWKGLTMNELELFDKLLKKRNHLHRLLNQQINNPPPF